MPLSWNEIRSRAVEFAKRWEHETSEVFIVPTFLRGNAACAAPAARDAGRPLLCSHAERGNNNEII